MFDFLLEASRTLLLLSLLLVLLKTSQHFRHGKGWKYFLSGVALTTLGTLVDLGDNFRELQEYSPLLGGSELHEFFEEVVCYLGGIALVCIGLAKWLPTVTETQDALEEVKELSRRKEIINAMTTDLTAVIDILPDGDMRLVWSVGTLHTEAGYNDEDIRTLSQWRGIVHKEDLALFDAHVRKVLEQGEAEEELQFITAKGKPLWVKIISKCESQWTPGTQGTILTAVRDVSGRKAAQEQTLQSLKLNKTLLQELHHRVKNNLQIITGLMEIAKGRITDPEVGSICQDIHSKINSMSLVHNQLYASRDMGRIDFGDYAKELTEQVADMFGRKDVAVFFDLAPVYVDIDKAIPCGLALNELLTNAYKHGAPHGNGSLYLRISIDGESNMIISVKDNGPGFPKDKGPEQRSSMGLKLLDNIVTLQLRGTLRYSFEQGTMATLTVPLAA